MQGPVAVFLPPPTLSDFHDVATTSHALDRAHYSPSLSQDGRRGVSFLHSFVPARDYSLAFASIGYLLC